MPISLPQASIDSTRFFDQIFFGGVEYLQLVVSLWFAHPVWEENGFCSSCVLISSPKFWLWSRHYIFFLFRVHFEAVSYLMWSFNFVLVFLIFPASKLGVRRCLFLYHARASWRMINVTDTLGASLFMGLPEKTFRRKLTCLAICTKKIKIFHT